MSRNVFFLKLCDVTSCCLKLVEPRVHRQDDMQSQALGSLPLDPGVVITQIPRPQMLKSFEATSKVEISCRGYKDFREQDDIENPKSIQCVQVENVVSISEHVPSSLERGVEYIIYEDIEMK
ncbi:predicted protein [Sclerotinia sclerotiorum 1980 UF-70]|uniref:Uncharacterized protein n=1 Tax=Sclerotinia sclerotiorum (strain ATCC 18683 / 1980 / Ss-1) TaxID=665079 RepID=A7EX57_SCLS1|nr:predicted protein [Sclerotinia sclerotiorum 1980 UF-70]EDN94049.1 predicted protein [Sclerotinia sclerotiorum 1980 UF-70]